MSNRLETQIIDIVLIGSLIDSREITHENVYMEQGLEKSWETHRKCAEMLWEGAEKLGLELLVQDKVCEGNRTILMFRKINSDSSAL